MTLKQRIEARNNRTVYINIETGEYALEPTIGFEEFKFRRVELEKIGLTTAALYSKTTEQKDQLLMLAIEQNKMTMDEYRAYREREGRPLREGDPLPAFDAAMFTDAVQEQTLQKAMVSPTLEELGGYGALADLAGALMKAYDAVFAPPKVGEALDTPETAETFPDGDGERVGQSGEEIRAQPVLVAEAVPESAAGLQPE